jgi:uncharacterized protein YuzE
LVEIASPRFELGRGRRGSAIDRGHQAHDAGGETDMKVRRHYDAKTNAAYPRFSSEAVVESEEVAPGVVLDYDAEGRIVGMEVLRACEHLPADALVAAE